MRKFIKQLLWFFLPFFLFLVGMEVALRNISNDYKYKKEYLDQHSEEIQTLILGSSHAFYGLNPAYFPDSTFNASHVSQSLDYDKAILEKYPFENLKTIILPISYFTFFECLSDAIDSWREKNYMLYYDIDISDRFANHFEMLSNDLFVNLKRLYLFYIKKDKNITVDPLGWGTIYHSNNQQDLVKTGKVNAFLNTKNLSSPSIQKIYEENQLILRTLIEQARKLNIRVIIFTPPAYETYRENLNEKQIKETIHTAEKIANEYPNCIYLNFLNDNRFYKNDFYDADHLNEIGAEKLSRIIILCGFAQEDNYY